MKKGILILPFFLLIFSAGFAQTPNPENDKHYTIGELASMGKLELTTIYIQEVQKLTLLVPYVPFNQKGEAVSLARMGVPNTKDNNDAVKLLDASGGSHNERISEALTNVIPYSDTKDIVRAILFLQDVIERIEAGI